MATEMQKKIGSITLQTMKLSIHLADSLQIKFIFHIMCLPSAKAVYSSCELHWGHGIVQIFVHILHYILCWQSQVLPNGTDSIWG